MREAEYPRSETASGFRIAGVERSNSRVIVKINGSQQRPDLIFKEKQRGQMIWLDVQRYRSPTQAEIAIVPAV